MKYTGLKIAVIFSLASLVAGCASHKPVTANSPEHDILIQEDKAFLDKREYENLPTTLTLENAIKRALEKNLDAYVASLETVIASNDVTLQKLAALPTVTASGTFIERSDEAASSSESIITRTQSLEPSTSTEQERRLASLEVQWNLLDSVIAYLDKEVAGNNEIVAKERLRKIRHNIERDVTAAYWKTYAHETLKGQLCFLQADIHQMINNVELAEREKVLPIGESTTKLSELASKNSSLSDLYEETKLAELELKSLISYPISTPLYLSQEQTDLGLQRMDLLNADMDTLVDTALRERPELRESLADQNTASSNVRKEILSTFPGFDVIYGFHYDSNAFLAEQNWRDFNASLTQSITGLLTLPKRLENIKNKQKLAEAQRLALTAAIVAQVYVANLRTRVAWDTYSSANTMYRSASRRLELTSQKEQEGMASGYEKIVADTEFHIYKTQKDLAYAELQKSYAELIGSLGHSLFAQKDVEDTEQEGGSNA